MTRYLPITPAVIAVGNMVSAPALASFMKKEDREKVDMPHIEAYQHHEVLDMRAIQGVTTTGPTGSTGISWNGATGPSGSPIGFGSIGQSSSVIPPGATSPSGFDPDYNDPIHGRR